MLLFFPLSFLVLLIFPSNAGQVVTGAREKNLREDACLLSLFPVQHRKVPSFCHPRSFSDFVLNAWRKICAKNNFIY